MENAFAATTSEVLKYFNVSDEKTGLTATQVQAAREKYGSNSIAEEEKTPIWELILEQFKDQLVIILLGSAAISFVLALFEDEGWMSFVDPAVVCMPYGKLWIRLTYLRRS